MMRVRVTRALWFGGRTHAPGEELQVEPLQASSLLDSGRAELVDAGSAAEIEAARRAEVARTLRAAGAAYRQPSSPWQSLP